MIGFDLEGNVIGGTGHLGDDVDFGGPGYDPKNPRKAATHEDLYPNRLRTLKAAGVSFWDRKAYKDWDEKTRALMGVKKGDKFSSEDWINTFGGMTPSQINEAAGNVEYYLNDNLQSTAQSAFKKDLAAINPAINVKPTIANFNTQGFNPSPSTSFDVTGSQNPFWGQLTGIEDLAKRASTQDMWRPGGTPNVKYVEQADHFFGTPPMSQLGVSNVINPFSFRGLSSLEEDPYNAAGKPTIQYEHQAVPGNEAGYFDQLAEKYPGWRSPVGGWRNPDEDKTFSSWEGDTFDYTEPGTARLPEGNLLSGMRPGTWDQGKFLLTGVQSELDNPEDLYLGSSEITHSFIPEGLHGFYDPQGDTVTSRIDDTTKNVKDLILINKTTAKQKAKKGLNPKATEIHEKSHLVHHIMMTNLNLWDKVQFINPNPSKVGSNKPGWGNTNLNAWSLPALEDHLRIYRTNPEDGFVKLDTMTSHPALPAQMSLIDLIAPVMDFRFDEDFEHWVMNREIDRPLLHAAIYAHDPNNTTKGFAIDIWDELEEHPFFEDIIKDESLKWSEQKNAAFLRAQALGLAINNASLNILNADPNAISKYMMTGTPKWGGMEQRFDWSRDQSVVHDHGNH